jgi:hypothetical protein
MQQTKQIKVKTIYPKDKPSFNDWCKEFNVSSMFIKDNIKYNTTRDTNIYKFLINKVYETI